MTAPPETPMISNPDISLARSGFFFNAAEKMMENTFATNNPNKNTMVRIPHMFPINSIETRAGIAINMLTIKNLRPDNFISRIAPAKAPIVLATK